MSDSMGTGGWIAAIVSGLGGATWIGKLLIEYVKGKNELNKELVSLKDQVGDLTDKKDELIEKLKVLKAQHDLCEEKLKNETRDRRALQQKLASIEVAFNITYLHLKTKVGPDDPILGELKKHIDKGTGNLT